MKKLLMLALAAMYAAALLAGCQASPTPAQSPSPAGSPSASASPSGPTQSPAAPTGSVKTGLAVITALDKSVDAGENPGVAQVDSTIVAVTVDESGRIQKCVIDAVQAKIQFDKTGKLITPTDTVFKTKNELGEAYGLKKASGIGKEWNEQAEAFAKYVEGKTVDEVKGIKVDEKSYPTQTDLKASVTISIGNFVKAIEKAVASAQSLGASAGDRLSVGVVTTMGRSSSATGEKEGLAQAYSIYAAITRDVSGKITSCVIDGTQANVNFSAQGKITTDLTVAPQTKNELKEAYGMKKASGIGKEWYEEAAAFAKYVTGKTPEEVAGIAVDEGGRPVSEDLKSSVTISVGDFKQAIAKAAGAA